MKSEIYRRRPDFLPSVFLDVELAAAMKLTARLPLVVRVRRREATDSTRPSHRVYVLSGEAGDRCAGV